MGGLLGGWDPGDGWKACLETATESYAEATQYAYLEYEVTWNFRSSPLINPLYICTFAKDGMKISQSSLLYVVKLDILRGCYCYAFSLQPRPHNSQLTAFAGNKAITNWLS